MPPMELRLTIEERLDSWDAESQQREQTFSETQNLQERIKREKEQIEKSLDEAVPKFDELLNLLDKEHIVVPSGKNLTESNYQRIVELSRVIYKELMLALHLTRDHDFIENPSLGKYKDSPELSEHIPIASLKKKIKAHFILAELYAALGIRIEPELEDRGARKEYEKVIEEGKILFKRLEDSHEIDLFEKMRNMIGSAYHIGASNKRLFDLYVEADKKCERVYGKIKVGEDSRFDDYVKDSREWYSRMFDIAHKPIIPLELEKVFHTEYEFKRYLHDINDLNMGCIFQKYAVKGYSEGMPVKNFNCSKKGEKCSKAHKEDSHCTYLENIAPIYNGLIERIEHFID